MNLKEPGPITSDFSQTFGDFGTTTRRKLIGLFFSLPLVNFTAEIFTVWKILMKMWQYAIGKYVISYCTCPNGLTDLNEIWNQYILGDDASFE